MTSSMNESMGTVPIDSFFQNPVQLIETGSAIVNIIRFYRGFDVPYTCQNWMERKAMRDAGLFSFHTLADGYPPRRGPKGRAGRQKKQEKPSNWGLSGGGRNKGKREGPFPAVEVFLFY